MRGAANGGFESCQDALGSWQHPYYALMRSYSASNPSMHALRAM